MRVPSDGRFVPGAAFLFADTVNRLRGRHHVTSTTKTIIASTRGVYDNGVAAPPSPIMRENNNITARTAMSAVVLLFVGRGQYEGGFVRRGLVARCY